ncbi:Alpha/Beta hydrolase protein [Aspergillus heterothallicus]
MAAAIWRNIVGFVQGAVAYLTPWRNSTALQTERIDEALRYLEQNRVGELRKRFIAPIRLLLPDSVLDRGWKDVCTTFGRLKGAGDPAISKGWLISTIKVPLQFDNARFGLLLHMTLGGSLVGLRFVPLHRLGLGQGWRAPRYADKNHREFDICLGTGEFKVGGTLCLPPAQAKTSKWPCVVLVAGSGPCDRHSTVEENKPFSDLAWGLAGQDIASIRFDKVTHAHSKAFRKKKKNVTLTDEYVEHVVAALSYARGHPDILPDKVFLLGHSLGAVVAPKIALLHQSVAGCIIMAGPAEPIYRCLVRQLRYIESLGGPEAPYLGRQIEQAQSQAAVADSNSLNLSTPAKNLPFGIGPAYWLDYRKFDPLGSARSLSKPILVLQGGRDYQVTVKDDYERWQLALQGKSNAQFRLYSRLNHLFIAGDRPSTPLEYSVPGNVDELVITDISTWISECLSAVSQG